MLLNLKADGRLPLTLLAMLLPFPCADGLADNPVDFAREILPVLSDKCFLCHGPDSGTVSDLRLDSFDGAIADLGGHQALVPNKPEQSRLIARIHDQDDPMPPVDAGRQLTDAERDLLTRWIREGGEYAKHWAYVPPKRTETSIDELVADRFPPVTEFAAEADRAIIARRAALVLTGLPPEPEQLSRFLKDSSDNAYERFVDGLLASDSFGEHQARYWLDAVRYGDTHGLHLDNRRGIFPYRDWVIQAFNRNQPFDEFLTWQLAGDLLPDPDLEQLVATGFVRMNPSTSEGGVIPAEFQAKNNFDRVETLGTALLGASFVCARCHTHKYDPITHQDYFQLVAFFNSTAESPLDGNSYEYGPVVKAPADIAAWNRWEQLTMQRTKLLAATDTSKLELAKSYAITTTNWKVADWRISPPVSRDADAPDAVKWKAIKQNELRKERFPKANEARWIEWNLETPIQQTLVLRSNGGPGSELHVDRSEGTESRSLLLLPLPSGTSRIRLKITGSSDKLPMQVDLQNPWKSLVDGKSWQTCSDNDRLLMLADPNGPFFSDQQHDDVAQLASQSADAESQFTTTLVAKELPAPRETKVLDRGEYNLPKGEPLQPAVPNVMGALPADAPKNRLGLAQWLTSKDNPLVARVLVNRFWQQTFGYGLVRTPEDFGLQGEQPTHPELLDWLAIEFRESGWDLKAILKRIVMSRTFRQDSKWRHGISDPENRLFARGPSFRLDAEVLRDMALWSSGLLNTEMGGEGVKPWQPNGLWKALMHPASNTKDYVPDNDGRELRRSIYVYWKRTSPHPMMTLFDAPNRESSCVRRSRSNTPLQSLGLLNEAQRIQAARALADRLMSEAGSTDQQRLESLFAVVASRKPSDAEQDACLQLLNTMQDRYTSAPKDAADLVADDRITSPVEHAAWIQVVTTVLASDIAILLY